MANLNAQISSVAGQPASVRIGVVASADPLIITAQGVPFINIGTLGTLVPQVGMTVALLGQSSASGSDPTSWLVLGGVVSEDYSSGFGPSAPPLATLRQTVAQSIPNNASTPLIWDLVVVDTAGGFDLTAPTRYTAQVRGRYQVSGGTTFAPNATGVRENHWRLNGVDVNATGILFPGQAAASNRLPARTSQLFLEVGQFVELPVFQNSGVALLTGVNSTEQSSLEICYLGAV